MPYFLIIIISLSLLISLSSTFIVLFHELGHAIPAILLTKQKVTIYIGSYGDPNKSLKINFGALVIFFRYNPFNWRMGLCSPSAETISINKQIVYTLTGPLTSFLLGSFACYFAFAYDLHGFLKLFFIVFLGTAFFDLLNNLIPSETPIKLYDGTYTYNDGYNLKQLFYNKRQPKEYFEAVDLYNEQRFADAAILFASILNKRVNDKNLYRLIISCYIQDKNYEKSKEVLEAFALSFKMNSDDLSNYALSHSQLGLHDKAMEIYDKSLQQNPDNIYSLNNKGYTLNLKNRFEEAISYFNRAIELDIDFAYSYNNRGLSKIKLGQVEEGLQDINRSFELDPNNSYCYMNIGIYHFDKGEFDTALQQFLKAKELDSKTYLIDKLISDAKYEIDKTAASDAF